MRQGTSFEAGPARRCHDAVRRVVRDGQSDGSFTAAASADTVTFTIFGVVNELPVWYRPTGRSVQAAGPMRRAGCRRSFPRR